MEVTHGAGVRPDGVVGDVGRRAGDRGAVGVVARGADRVAGAGDERALVERGDRQRASARGPAGDRGRDRRDGGVDRCVRAAVQLARGAGAQTRRQPGPRSPARGRQGPTAHRDRGDRRPVRPGGLRPLAGAATGERRDRSCAARRVGTRWRGVRQARAVSVHPPGPGLTRARRGAAAAAGTRRAGPGRRGRAGRGRRPG